MGTRKAKPCEKCKKKHQRKGNLCIECIEEYLYKKADKGAHLLYNN